MEDQQILAMFFERSEQAIVETDKKYGAYCYGIAYNILSNREDSEESVSDAYLAAWNTIPPRRPNVYRAFLGKLTRHISIDRWRRNGAQKRGGGEICLALEELGECAGPDCVEQMVEARALAHSIHTFLSTLSQTERNVFLCRYWYLDSVADIATFSGFSQSKVSTMLHRLREKLRRHLKMEGFV